MRRTVVLALAALALASPARADMALDDLAGSWRGEGQLTRDGTQELLRCRLTFKPVRRGMNLDGRCATPAGGQGVHLVLEPRDGGLIELSERGAPDEDPVSDIKEILGRVQGDALIFSGAGGDESVTIRFDLRPDGGLVFATERLDGDAREAFEVLLAPVASP